MLIAKASNSLYLQYQFGQVFLRNKFFEAERPVKQSGRNYCIVTAETITEEQKLRKENALNEFFDECKT